MGSELHPIIPIISLHALLYLFYFAVYLLEIPKVRLIEHAVCQRYRSHPLAEGGAEYNVPERQCKLVPIQAEVALITGWRMSLDAIPSVLTITFYGALADQIGRKPALLLVCLGELLALIWTVLVCMSSYCLLPPGCDRSKCPSEEPFADKIEAILSGGYLHVWCGPP